MLRFIVEFVIFFALTSASVVPLVLVGRKLRRRVDRKKWLTWAGIFALAAALLGFSSRSLQGSCLQERNEGCVDAGGAGTQLLVLGGFVFWALLSAYLRYNDY